MNQDSSSENTKQDLMHFNSMCISKSHVKKKKSEAETKQLTTFETPQFKTSHINTYRYTSVKMRRFKITSVQIPTISSTESSKRSLVDSFFDIWSLNFSVSWYHPSIRFQSSIFKIEWKKEEEEEEEEMSSQLRRIQVWDLETCTRQLYKRTLSGKGKKEKSPSIWFYNAV